MNLCLVFRNASQPQDGESRNVNFRSNPHSLELLGAPNKEQQPPKVAADEGGELPYGSVSEIWIRLGKGYPHQSNEKCPKRYIIVLGLRNGLQSKQHLFVFRRGDVIVRASACAN
jgi:hypothetical protein